MEPIPTHFVIVRVFFRKFRRPELPLQRAGTGEGPYDKALNKSQQQSIICQGGYDGAYIESAVRLVALLSRCRREARSDQDGGVEGT
jgi:hypothetical protein